MILFFGLMFVVVVLGFFVCLGLLLI